MTVDQELRQVIAELTMVSHVSAAKAGNSSRDSSEGIGGKRPPGGIDRKDDNEREWPMKSADHFARRMDKARTERALTEILADARASLECYRRMPAPNRQNEPPVSSPQWKRFIAESTESHGALARHFNVRRSYIQEIREKYGDARVLDAA